MGLFLPLAERRMKTKVLRQSRPRQATYVQGGERFQSLLSGHIKLHGWFGYGVAMMDVNLYILGVMRGK